MKIRHNDANLKYAFYSYLTLGSVDTIHHLHAAIFLDQTTAIHAAILGLILVPLAVYAFIKISGEGNRNPYCWLFIFIALSAITVPGIYHGGWDHLVKVLAHLRIDSPHTYIKSLFPTNGFHLWFYEITGIFEFIMAVVCLYFVIRVISQGLSGR